MSDESPGVTILRKLSFANGVCCLLVCLGAASHLLQFGPSQFVADGGLLVLVPALLGLPLLLLGARGLPTRARGSWLARKGLIAGRRYWRLDKWIEVDMRAANAAILGRRELEEIAAGEASRRTGSFAAKPEFREAVSVLLRSGQETVLFLEPEGVRFEGYKRGPLEDVVRALIRLAGPGFVLSRHAGTGVCPYCKGEIASEPASCDACGAEHHASCLAEHGGCAIFGCERAPSARRAREKA